MKIVQTGKYVGNTRFKVRTPEQLNIDDVLSRTNPMKLYTEQIVPINPSYSNNVAYWVAPKNITIREGHGGISIDKGDEIHITVDNPANGNAESATSYKVWVRNRSYPLLHFIPETADHGAIGDTMHYDAIVQMKNFDSVLNGELETPFDAEKRRIKIAESLIPEKDFYTCRPMHSGRFESPQRVIIRDGKYLKLRQDHWVSKAEYEKESRLDRPDFNEDEFNIWGKYDTKSELAWDIVNNAYLIHSEVVSGKELSDLWHKQYDYLVVENKAQYKTERIKG